MKDIISHFYPPKLLKLQKMYLRWALYKPCNTNIREFICRIDKMIEYLDKFPSFREGQRPPEENSLDLVELLIPKERKKELIIQGFESVTQSLTELVEFCERLKTAEERFQMEGEGNHQKKKQSGERHQSAKSAHIKGSYQAANPSEEGANKNKNRNKNSPVYPLHCPGNNINS